MHNDELQTRLQVAIEKNRNSPRPHDLTIGQGQIKTACEVSGNATENHFPDVRKMVADRILKIVDVNGAYSTLARALNLITGKSRLRDCSENELLALESSLKNAVIWTDPLPTNPRRS